MKEAFHIWETNLTLFTNDLQKFVSENQRNPEPQRHFKLQSFEPEFTIEEEPAESHSSNGSFHHNLVLDDCALESLEEEIDDVDEGNID